MTSDRITENNPTPEAPPAEGTRRLINGQERVYYDGYWVKTYPAPANSLEARKRLIQISADNLEAFLDDRKQNRVDELD